MKIILLAVCFLISICSYGQTKLYAERLNANNTKDSFYVKDGTDSVFNSGGTFVSFTVEYYKNFYNAVYPNSFENYVKRADGIWINQNVISSGISLIPTTISNELEGKASTVHAHAIGDVTNLQTSLDGKQATLVSGSNIKTVNGNNLLGSGDVSITSAVSWGNVTGLLASQTDLVTALGLKADATALVTKQDALVSGTNIKTINGQSVLGSGNLVAGGNSISFLPLTANVSTTSTVNNVVTDWVFPVVSGKTYRIEIIADYQTSATTTGGSLGVSLNVGGTGSIRGFARGAVNHAAAATELAIPIRTTVSGNAGSLLTTTGVGATNTPHFIHLLVTFTSTSNSTFSITWATEVNGSAAQLNAGSTLIVQELN